MATPTQLPQSASVQLSSMPSSGVVASDRAAAARLITSTNQTPVRLPSPKQGGSSSSSK